MSKGNSIFHSMDVDKTCEFFKVDIQKGLSAEEVLKRREKYGPNELEARKSEPGWMRFLKQFHQPLIYILIGAAIITLLLSEYVDSFVIFAVVVINGLIGFIQETKAVKALDALSRSMITETTVIRNGKRQKLDASEIVPGDIIFLQTGDRVPADMRIVKSKDVRAEEAALTGESVPVGKFTESLPQDISLADRKNMLYASTHVTYGQVTGVATATGDKTEVGKISELISTAEKLETPLTKNIQSFSHILLWIIILMALIAFGIGVWVQGETPADMFIAAVAIAVGAIPEGLPAALTITLAIGVSRMAQRNAIIRKLPAVETLGSTMVICSDKTGTLTENQMTVQSIFSQNESFNITGSGYAAKGEIVLDEKNISAENFPALINTLYCGLLCNDSGLEEVEGEYKIQGDPTEVALIVAAMKSGLTKENCEKKYSRLDIIPFESEHQIMATLHEWDEDNKIFIKGSIEKVLERCASMMDRNGKEIPIETEPIIQKAEELAGKGLRVLAFACKDTDKKELNRNDIESNCIFTGLQGMIDPPRKEAVQAVHTCHKASINVKMITGDHALTARAIACELGIVQSFEDAAVLTGSELSDISDKELYETVKHTNVFARVSPEQKLRLVKAIQAQENVVAMTGDGVNDAPALKQANIGIAMGITGTEVTKEEADMVLTDDNFASIEAAVEEGRGVFDNIKKFIVWTLPTNIGEGSVILLAILMGVALPISPVQILWINMTSAVFLGMMLAFEPKEKDIMERRPRNPSHPLLDGFLIARIIVVGTILLGAAFYTFTSEIDSGKTLAQAQTAAVTIFIVVEAFFLLNCRSLTKTMFQIGVFSNLWIWGGITIMMIFQLLLIYVPFMNTLFQTAPIDAGTWIKILSFGAGTYIFMLFYKQLEKILYKESGN